MEIKRNIFDSRVRMPPKYENVAVYMTQEETPNQPMVGLQKNDRNIVHARSPRIGKK